MSLQRPYNYNDKRKSSEKPGVFSSLKETFFACTQASWNLITKPLLIPGLIMAGGGLLFLPIICIVAGVTGFYQFPDSPLLGAVGGAAGTLVTSAVAAGIFGKIDKTLNGSDGCSERGLGMPGAGLLVGAALSFYFLLSSGGTSAETIKPVPVQDAAQVQATTKTPNFP